MTIEDHVEDRLRTALKYLADETPVDMNLQTVTQDGQVPRVGNSRAWSRRTRTVAALAATLVISTGVMAIGSGGYMGEDGPDPEYAPLSDFPEIVRNQGGDIPFAAHRSLEDVIASWDDGPLMQEGEDGLMSIEGMVDTAARAAVCSWLDQWRNATMAGDDAAAAQAEQMISNARHWPWWSLVNQQRATDRLSSHLAAMRNDDGNYITYQLGLNCHPAMTDAQHISPKADRPLPDGVSVPENFYRNG